ncbi:Pycsar system effector family protein (plasmid) [Agrobacterium sp. rho-13.3]|uniref:Pycsar system effector family protein n=1 Tax=Agrobacterium sp. rho-13.3 TaxID=3072980 RepID=UPI000DDECAE7|nr:Pycsar system effector family protein [Agrobacterium sp. rho-13.3]MDX8310312.1 DUF5706 domain-containing protein [Agrobacterium sp. rho-13.3]
MGQISDLQDQLNRLLDLAHHQVHFAEAKNGALLTLNFALVMGMVAISGEELAWQWRLYMLSVGSALGLSGLVAMTSFLPRMTSIKDERRKALGNVAFTGDIALMGSESLLRTLALKMGVSEEPTHYCSDLADQTYVNARIAERKFRRFRLAAWMTLSGIIAPTIWVTYQMAAGVLPLWS